MPLQRSSQRRAGGVLGRPEVLFAGNTTITINKRGMAVLLSLCAAGKPAYVAQIIHFARQSGLVRGLLRTGGRAPFGRWEGATRRRGTGECG